MQKHLFVDDYTIGTVPKNLQVKIGAYLTNIMCKNLKFRCGSHKFMLLKPQLVRSKKKIAGGKFQKYIGFI
jgi:hypothetical protein